jgi:hypothetical protein
MDAEWIKYAIDWDMTTASRAIASTFFRLIINLSKLQPRLLNIQTWGLSPLMTCLPRYMKVRDPTDDVKRRRGTNKFTRL